MRIKSNETIGKYSVITIRKFLKHLKNNFCSENEITNFIAYVLKINKITAEEIFEILKNEKLIEIIKDRDIFFWTTTIKGNSLSMASAAKPILRKTAEKIIKNFLERVHHINEDNYYLYKIKKVIVFWSYLSSQEKLGDIDIAIKLIPIESNEKKQSILVQKRAKETIEKGRNFSSFIE